MGLGGNGQETWQGQNVLRSPVSQVQSMCVMSIVNTLRQCKDRLKEGLVCEQSPLTVKVTEVPESILLLNLFTSLCANAFNASHLIQSLTTVSVKHSVSQCGYT